jgi:hypothetical protein
MNKKTDFPDLDSTPIILDLDGDGIETISKVDGVTFDIDADGNEDTTGWVGSDDGLLVRDVNDDGIINDASELFGEEMVKADGTVAKDGYDALREYDTNADGVIDANDEEFDKIKVWKDANSDGVTDEGELLTLEEAGVKQLNMGNIVESNETQNGNIMSLKSDYVTTDGETRAAVDVNFGYNSEKSSVPISEDDDMIYFTISLDPLDKETTLNFSFKGEGDSTSEIKYMEYADDFRV